MRKRIEMLLDEAINIRRALHQIPELKYEEHKTSAFIADTLLSYGYEVQKGIGKTGIVSILDTGKPGKTIAFRADIDALPITESTGVSYQSNHHGIMHACGHDGHTASLLLTARILQSLKPHLKGKIKLIFQPAEEGGKGSTAMIQDGVLNNPAVDAIFGYHNWPGLRLNAVATRPGCILAGSGRFEIVIRGKRAHLARPQDGENPVSIGAQIVQKIENISIQNTIINLIGFNTGDWKLGMSEKADIVGCYFLEGKNDFKKLQTTIHSIVEPYGSVVFYEFQAPTINTAYETKKVLMAAKNANIQDIRILDTCKMAAEDFSEYLKMIPGCYFLIGAGEAAASLHTPKYDFPDQILRTAAEVMVQIAINN